MCDAQERDALAPRAWVERYLALLGVEHPAPSPMALTRLTRAHVGAVLFENVTSILRRRAHPTGPVPPVDPEALLESWERGRGGGVCFELAEMFARLLVALGYRAHPVLGDMKFPGAHQAVLVELGGRRYLADVGNGAPFFEPIPLEGEVEVRRVGLTYRFRPGGAGGGWVQDRLIAGDWEPFCRYRLRPPDPREREAAYQRHHTPGESWVVGDLTLIRLREDEVRALRNRQLSRFTADGRRSEPVEEAACARLAAEVFGMPGLPVEEALRALAAGSPAPTA
jgi:N-hydroxyarylamine O-acetyltransferase